MLSKESSDEGIRLEERDIALFRGLFESRIMTARHIATLYFSGREPATKQRLYRLKVTGYLGERRRKAYEPAILFLTKKAFDVLREQGILQEYPRLNPASLEKRAYVSDLTLQHELEVMDVKAAFHGALAGSDRLSLKQFNTWPLLNQFEIAHPRIGKKLLIRPDAFVRIREKESATESYERDFYLEVDRSSENPDSLVVRADCYREFYRSGGFAVRNGGTMAEYKKFCFLVLMVFKSAERRNNMAERLLQHTPPILMQCYLTTLPEVLSNPLGSIWIRPADYRDAVKGTRFESLPQRKVLGYRRQSERELIVEQKAKKVSFLDRQ